MDNVWTIILAAGASSRFGGIKALAPWQEGTLLSQAIATAQGINSQVLVVTGAHHETLLPHLTVPYLYNEQWASGMGSSIACGIAAVPDTAALAIILPVDQPLVTPQHLQRLAVLSQQSGEAVFTESCGVIGPPVALPRAFFSTALTLTGEQGLKHVLAPHDFTVLANAEALIDIDTQEDLQRAQSPT